MDVRRLDVDESAGLDDHRRWIAEFLVGVGSDVRLTRQPEDLPTLQSLLDNGPYTEEPLGELQALATAFGDVLASELDMHWVVVTDDIGADFALRHATKSVFVFPYDVLVKRVESGEEISLVALCLNIVGEIRRQIEADILNSHENAP